MYLNFFIVLEMMFKNLFNRNFTLKPIACLTNHLFYSGLTSMEYFFVLDPKARVLNTQREVDINCSFNYSGYDVRFHFFTKNALPHFLKKSKLLTFFLEKRLTISKDGVELYSDGIISEEYEKHAVNIQNLLWFVGDDLRNKKDEHRRLRKMSMAEKA